MNLEKAIAGLEDLLVDDPHFDPDRRREAVKIGIEAIKRLEQLREGIDIPFAEPLPGEKEG